MHKIYPLVIALSLGAAGSALANTDLPVHQLPVSPTGNKVVGLCDGETSVEVPGTKPGDTLTQAQGQWVADALMKQWMAKHPDAQWQMASNEVPQPSSQTGDSTAVMRNGTPNPAAPGAPHTGSDDQTQTYGAFTARDRAIWKASTDQLIAEGNRIFHDAKALGGTDAISCDMCHPNAANTHPETYPKYQVQLGRVAMLRDMINWCIENPVRGKPFADDDPRMKALEAYILSQRKGVPLNYGEH